MVSCAVQARTSASAGLPIGVTVTGRAPRLRGLCFHNRTSEILISLCDRRAVDSPELQVRLQSRADTKTSTTFTATGKHGPKMAAMVSFISLGNGPLHSMQGSTIQQV